jgi:hypothetical protein
MVEIVDLYSVDGTRVQVSKQVQAEGGDYSFLSVCVIDFDITCIKC